VPLLAIALCLNSQTELIDATSDLLSSIGNLFICSPGIISKRWLSIDVSKFYSSSQKPITTTGLHNFFEVVEESVAVSDVAGLATQIVDELFGSVD
jgi:hypothetical protein